MKILVSDYDKTFYLNDDDIKENILNIKEFIKQGNMFIIDTGRSFLDFKNVVNIYNFYYDFAILNHGATIIDNKDNIIYDTHIDDEIINDMKNDLDLNNSVRHFCCSSLESRVFLSHGNISKINIKYPTKEKAIKIYNTIKNKYSKFINIYHVSEYTIEIIPKEVSKSKGIEILINKLNLNKDDVYTIGDGYSDIEMVKDYNGYSMKESVNELKSISKKEYNSVSELIKDLQNL